MNVNEVISNRSIEILNIMGEKSSIHPNDHVNKNQSSNRTFSIGKELFSSNFVDVYFLAMHIAVILKLLNELYSTLKSFQTALKNKLDDFASMSMLDEPQSQQDLVPTTLIQRFHQYIDQISMNIKRFEKCQTQLYQLAIDDPAVGQGINATNGFGKDVAQCLKDLTGFPFIDASDKFEELNTYNIMVELSGTLSTLAISLSE